MMLLIIELLSVHPRTHRYEIRSRGLHRLLAEVQCFWDVSLEISPELACFFGTNDPLRRCPVMKCSFDERRSI
jgi:hypothetical protein